MAVDGVLSNSPFTIAAPAPRRARALALLVALRPVQWSKNLLVFLPLLLAHQLTDIDKLSAVFIAFVATSLCASAGYLLNDSLDAAADRRHPVKRHRPIPAGLVSPGEAALTAIALAVAGITLAELLLSPQAALLLVGYLLLTALYSLKLKRKLMADVVALVLCYGHRLLLGGVVTGVSISPWLLAFSLFLFLSLAIVKRYAELLAADLAPGQRVARRAYQPEDLEILRSVGPTCGCLSVLVLCLYINLSPDVQAQYAQPPVLYLACPLVLYWICRVWFLAHRRAILEDPVVFALTDRVSLVVGILVLGIVGLAKWGLPLTG